jgi:hypothetical protein
MLGWVTLVKARQGGSPTLKKSNCRATPGGASSPASTPRGEVDGGDADGGDVDVVEAGGDVVAGDVGGVVVPAGPVGVVPGPEAGGADDDGLVRCTADARLVGSAVCRSSEWMP